MLQVNGNVTDVKVSDFGSVLNLDSEVTQIYRVGSLAYMSPEQLDGGVLDCRADMYSLGAVLYHLIAGRPPFDAQMQSAMMHQIYHVQPGPLAALRAGVSDGLDAVIQRALAKDPAQRYANWDEFAQALSGLITGQQVILGLDPTGIALTLLLSVVTFSGPRTTVLEGGVHLLVFFVYIVLVFSP